MAAKQVICNMQSAYLQVAVSEDYGTPAGLRRLGGYYCGQKAEVSCWMKLAPANSMGDDALEDILFLWDREANAMVWWDKTPEKDGGVKEVWKIDEDEFAFGVAKKIKRIQGPPLSSSEEQWLKTHNTVTAIASYNPQQFAKVAVKERQKAEKQRDEKKKALAAKGEKQDIAEVNYFLWACFCDAIAFGIYSLYVWQIWANLTDERQLLIACVLGGFGFVITVIHVVSLSYWFCLLCKHGYSASKTIFMQDWDHNLPIELEFSRASGLLEIGSLVVDVFGQLAFVYWITLTVKQSGSKDGIADAEQHEFFEIVATCTEGFVKLLVLVLNRIRGVDAREPTDACHMALEACLDTGFEQSLVAPLL